MLKAIETKYKGYRFRSRLEARWAVFFDTLEMPWEYEKEGFDLDGLWYLPDFWLPKNQLWVEIKGEVDDKAAKNLLLQCGRLAYHSQHPVILAVKDPLDVKCVLFEPKYERSENSVGAVMHGNVGWGACPACGHLGLKVPGSNFEFFLCPYNGVHILKPIPENIWRRHDRRLFDAATAARSARFEHGERP